MNDNHAIPSAMSGFITELLTLAVYSNFLLSLLEPYKDREAIQTPELLCERQLKHYLTNVLTAIAILFFITR